MEINEYFLKALTFYNEYCANNNAATSSSASSKHKSQSNLSKLTTTTTPKSNKKRFRDADDLVYPTHALIFWKKDQRYSVVPYGDIQGEGEIKETDIRMVKWKAREFYEATIITLSAKDICDEMLLVKSSEHEQNKTTANQKPAKQNKVVSTVQATNWKEKSETLETELAALRLKYLELEQLYTEKGQIISQFESRLERANNEILSLRQAYSNIFLINY